MGPFTSAAWIEIARRTLAQLALLLGAIAGFGHGDWWAAALWAAAGLAVYLALPRPRPPEGSIHAARMPSVHMPDLVGALLVTTFLALPFILVAREPLLVVPWGPMLLTWPPGLIAVAIYVVATRYQCFWLRLDPAGVTIATWRGERHIPWVAIRTLEPELRRPPRWLSLALVLFGGWRGAGIALLHGNRASHRVVLTLADGERVVLPMDAVPQPDRVIRRFRQAGVTVRDPG